MRMELRTFDMAFLAGLAALVLLGGFATVRAARARSVQVAMHKREVYAQREELQKAEGRLATLDAAIQSNQKALDALRRRLPEAQDIGSFLAAVDVVATRNQAVVISVVPGTRQGGKQYGCKDSDDGDDDKQFNQCEAFGSHRVSPLLGSAEEPPTQPTHY